MNQEVKMICQAISSKKGVLIKVLDVKDLTSVAARKFQFPRTGIPI